MPTLIIKTKITKGYEHWSKADDSAEELRVSQYGIRPCIEGMNSKMRPRFMWS